MVARVRCFMLCVWSALICAGMPAAAQAAADAAGFVRPEQGQAFPEFSHLSLYATGRPASYVEFYVNGLRCLGTVTRVEDGYVTEPFLLRIGSYTAEVRTAYWNTNEPAGNQWTTSRVAYLVQSFWTSNSAPYLKIDPCLDGATVLAGYDVALLANAQDNTAIDRVEFWAGGSLVASGVSNWGSPTPRWFGTWSDVPAGTHSVHAVAYDVEGFASTSPVARIVSRNFDRLLPVDDGYAFQRSTPWDTYRGVNTTTSHLEAAYIAGNWSYAGHTILEFDLSSCPTGRFMLAAAPLLAEAHGGQSMEFNILFKRGNGVVETSDYYITPGEITPFLTSFGSVTFPETRSYGLPVFSSRRLTDVINGAITAGWSHITIVLQGATDGALKFASTEHPSFAPAQLICLGPPIASYIDQDADGQPDAQEEIAGTDPQDPFSHLAADPAGGNADAVKLSFYCTPGRLYRVQRCSSLSNPRWETVKSLPAGTAGRVTVTDDYRYQLDDNGRPILLSNMYYRVGARLE